MDSGSEVPENTRLSSIPTSLWNLQQVKGKAKLNNGTPVRFVAKVLSSSDFSKDPPGHITPDYIQDPPGTVALSVIWVDGFGMIDPYLTEASPFKLFTVHVWSYLHLEIGT